MAGCPVNVGDVIAGKYLVESVIGEGGMGVVVAARHLELEQRVAIKFLLPAIAEQELAAQRFRREARAAARIRGEHVCRVLDVGSLEAGVPYMVMEYLEGCDLAAELTRRKRLPIEELVDYVLQACEALAEAHAAGIVHRDLKPGNLFLSNSADGTRRIKVLDFGVSKFLVESGSGSPALTKTSSLVGSPIYMAPEQFDGSKRVDERTDIWALGIVLYELATGVTPFESETIAQLISSVLHAKPMSFADHGLTVPDGFEAIVERALAKQPDDRFASVSELAQALVPYGPTHASLRASRVSRLLPSVPRHSSRQSSIPNPSRTPNPKNRTPIEGSKSEPDKPPSIPRGPTPNDWEMSKTRVDGRTQARRFGVAAAVVLLPLIAGFFIYRGTRTAEPALSLSANLPAPPAPEADTGKLEVAPEGPAAVAPAASGTPEPEASAEPEPAASAKLPSAAPAAPAHVRPAAVAKRPPPASAARPPEAPAKASTAPAPAKPPAAEPPGLSDFGGRR